MIESEEEREDKSESEDRESDSTSEDSETWVYAVWRGSINEGQIYSDWDGAKRAPIGVSSTECKKCKGRKNAKKWIKKRDKKRVNCQYFGQNFNKTGKKLIVCNNSASIVEKITKCNTKNLYNLKKFTNLIYFVIFM